MRIQRNAFAFRVIGLPGTQHVIADDEQKAKSFLAEWLAVSSRSIEKVYHYKILVSTK